MSTPQPHLNHDFAVEAEPSTPDVDKECPWCGEKAEPNEPMSYDFWIEGHVQECEPFMMEAYGPDAMWDQDKEVE